VKQQVLRGRIKMGLFRNNSALLIVDMINDFVEETGALPVPGAKEIVPSIAELAREAREIGAPVIYVNDSHDPDDAEFDIWGPHAVTGTEGTEVAKGLEPQNGDYVLTKKRFSAFFKTELEELLQRLGVEHLIITGTVTNICIFATALDAIIRGYSVSVVEAGVAALDEEDHRFALKQIEKVFGGEVA
jgi:nicotinamidase-related amidase